MTILSYAPHWFVSILGFLTGCYFLKIWFKTEKQNKLGLFAFVYFIFASTIFYTIASLGILTKYWNILFKLDLIPTALFYIGGILWKFVIFKKINKYNQDSVNKKQ